MSEEKKKKSGPKVKFLTLERVKERSTKEGDCHIWNGPWHRQGYPMVRFPQTKKMRTTYSVVWELLGNSVPAKGDKAKLTRTCDNIKCVNPEHIVLKDMSDVMKAARQTGNGCMFTPDEIRAIRKEYDENIYHGCVRNLAEKYNCKEGHMWSICNRRLYKWVK
jgi:hypothetical protein